MGHPGCPAMGLTLPMLPRSHVRESRSVDGKSWWHHPSWQGHGDLEETVLTNKTPFAMFVQPQFHTSQSFLCDLSPAPSSSLARSRECALVPQNMLPPRTESSAGSRLLCSWRTGHEPLGTSILPGAPVGNILHFTRSEPHGP